MSDRDAVLFANEAFYVAFAGGDMDAMKSVWVEDGPVTCIHPGWEPLSGRKRVMESWKAILSNPPPVACRAPRAHVLGGAGYVVCYEEIEGEHLIATNIFVRTAGGYRMVHHQAGPTRGEPPEETKGAAPRVN